MLIGLPAGGGADIIARYFADKLKASLNQTVVVENKPGAGGSELDSGVRRNDGGELGGLGGRIPTGPKASARGRA
jgi:tripartite-type tricarboxylate transporter receptor subunit TctC